MTPLDEPDFRTVAQTAFGIEAWFEENGRLKWVNPSIERVTGRTPAECIESADIVELLVYPKDRGYVLELARQARDGKAAGSAELRLRRKDDTLVWVAMFWSAIRLASGMAGIRLSAVEIQSRKEAELQLLDTVAELRRVRALQDHFLTRSNEERARLEALLNVMEFGVLFMDNENRVSFCNRQFHTMWGFDEAQTLNGLRHTALLDRTAGARCDDLDYRAHVEATIAGRRVSDPYECALADGRTLRDISAPVPGGAPGQLIGRVWIYEDVTERKRIEAKLVELAERDPLTNLYNRRRFVEELDRMIADASRRRSQVGLIAMDLDGFKPVNDRFGHQAGDHVLTTVAREVGAVIRRNEIFFRIGGDEFAIMVPEAEEEHLVLLARRVCATISQLHFQFEGSEAPITASLGIAIYPRHAADASQLIAHGDQAMYAAKVEGKNTCRVFEPAMATHARE